MEQLWHIAVPYSSMNSCERMWVWTHIEVSYVKVHFRINGFLQCHAVGTLLSPLCVSLMLLVWFIMFAHHDDKEPLYPCSKNNYELHK